MLFAFSFENFNPRKEDSYFLRVPLSRSLQLPVHLHKKNLLYSSSTHRLPDLRSRLNIFLRISDLPTRWTYGLFVHVTRSHLQINSRGVHYIGEDRSVKERKDGSCVSSLHALADRGEWARSRCLGNRSPLHTFRSACM